MAVVTSWSEILVEWMMDIFLFKLLCFATKRFSTERWLVFSACWSFQSVQYLVVCQTNGLARLQLAAVSNVPVLTGRPQAVQGLTRPSPSGCSCCPCCCGQPGRPSGGRPAALWPGGVSIWQAGPWPLGCRGGVNQSTRTCGGGGANHMCKLKKSAGLWSPNEL